MRLLPLLILLAGCSDASGDVPAEPTATPAVAAASGEMTTPSDIAPEAADLAEATGPEGDWEGRYTFTEGGGVYTYDYELVLGDEASGYDGTFSRIGPQETRFYTVRGEETDAGGLSIILTGFGEENVHTIPEVGETLFVLRWEDAGDLGDEVGDRTLMTYWDALGPTGVGESTETEKMLAFYPAVGE